MPAPEELLCPAYIHYSLVPWSSEHSDTSRVYRANRGSHFDTSHELRRFTDPASSTASILMGPAPLQSLLSRRCGQCLFAALGVLEVCENVPLLASASEVGKALVYWSELQWALAVFAAVLLGHRGQAAAGKWALVVAMANCSVTRFARVLLCEVNSDMPCPLPYYANLVILWPPY